MAFRRLRSMAALLLVAAGSAAVTTAPIAAPKQRLQSLFGKAADEVLVCPADGSALRAEVSIYGSTRRESRVSEAGMRYPVNRDYVELLASSGRTAEGGGITPAQFADELRDAFATRTQTQMFRSPVLGFLYERGWRQNFNNAGFPGIEKEFAEVSDFFSPSASGGVVVDMSCGSGLMYRRLLKSRKYGRVIACDYSEAMLKETRRRSIQEGLPRADLELCRCDVAQLPIRDGAVDAMHAGAALHSWPRAEAGLREIRRVLNPDHGRFFATTFLSGAYGLQMPGQQGGGGGSFRFFKSEMEIKQLLVEAGFPTEGISIRREGRGCVVIRAVLGGGSPDPPGSGGSSRLNRARRAVADASSDAPAPPRTRSAVSKTSTAAAGKLADAVAGAAADVAVAFEDAIEDVTGATADAAAEVEAGARVAQGEASAVVSRIVTDTAAAVQDAAGALSDAAAEVKAEAEASVEVEEESKTDMGSKAKKPSMAVAGEEEVLDARSIDSYEWSDDEKY